MTQRDRDDEPTPARMKDGPWEEFREPQPNRTDEPPVAPDREPAVPERIDHDDPVEEASDESFPASDPPSFNPGGG
jgi:hypothetical protein